MKIQFPSNAKCRRKSEPAAERQSLGDAGPERVVPAAAREKLEGAPFAADGALRAGQGGGDERGERRERGRCGVHARALLCGQNSGRVVRGATRLGAGESRFSSTTYTLRSRTS